MKKSSSVLKHAVPRSFTTHATAHEGGNKTHAMKQDGGSEPICGTVVYNFLFNAVDSVPKGFPLAALWTKVDCRRCLRKLGAPDEAEAK